MLSVPHFCAVLIVVAALVLTHTTASPSASEAAPHVHSNLLEKFPIMDGCRYIFLDVGSNIGMHARFLFEPELYPEQKYTNMFFDKYFPKEHRFKRKDVCVVGFEPNPRHRPRLQRLQAFYRAAGLQVHWFFAGVGAENGKKSFILDNRNTGPMGNAKNNDWGYRAAVFDKDLSLLDKKHLSSTEVSMPHVEELTIIRFADFIRDKVLNRTIPRPLFAADPPPAVIAKIDIENEEYVVLHDLLRAGDAGDSHLFCALAAISIEYHYYNAQSEVVMPAPRGAAQGQFSSIVELKKAITTAQQQPVCHTHVVEYDSEDYRLDTSVGKKILEEFSKGYRGRGGSRLNGGINGYRLKWPTRKAKHD